MTYLTITMFDTREEYCSFLAILAKQGFKRVNASWQSNDLIRKRNPRTKVRRIGYAAPYEGKLGTGWRVYIHNHSSSHSGDSRVIYFVKE